MSYDIGPKIGIEGEKEFRNAITAINTRIKTLGTEMKAVTAAYDKNDTSAGKLTAQQRVLTAQVELQVQKLRTMNDCLNRAKGKYGENSAITQQWQQQVNRAAEQLHLANRALEENAQALADAAKGTDGLAEAEAEAARAADELKRAQEAAADGIANASDKLGKSAQAMDAVNRAALIAAASVAALGAASAKVGMDFEAQMSKVEAVSGATASEIAALTEKAQEMGATTKFTATQSGEALEYMAMAGWKAGQMIDGLPGMMNLAAASGEDLGRVSDIVTDALTAFGLQASDSAHFADVLAKAASSSNTDVGMMGETFKYAAPVAGALGYSIEDTAVAIGLMANAGIKGEMAGTSLRAMLTNLTKPSGQVAGYMDKLGISLTDSAGEVKPLNKLLAEMRSKFSALTDAQKAEYAAGIAGKEAMSGMLALVNAAPKDYDALIKSIEQADGTAKTMADTMNDNLKGSLTLLGSAAEGAGIAFYDKFAEPASDAVRVLADKVGKFTQDMQSGALDDTIAGLGAAAGAAAIGITAMNAVLVAKDVANFASAVSGGAAMLENYTAATKAGAVAQGALNLVQSISPMGMLAIAAGAVVAGLALYVNMTGKAQTETERLAESVETLSEGAEEYKKKQDDLNAARDEMLSSSLAELNHVQSMADELSTLTDETGKVKDGEQDRARLLSNMINEIMPGAVNWTEEQGNAYAVTAEKLDALIKKEELKAWLDANASGYQAAIQNQNDLIAKSRESEQSLNQLKAKHAELSAQLAAEQERPDIDYFKIDQLKSDLTICEGALTEAQAMYDGYTNQFLDNSMLVQEYESNKAALLSGEEAKISAALEKASLDLKKYTGNNLSELRQQEVDTQANYEKLLEWAKDYPEAISEAQLTEAKRRADEAAVIAEQAGKEEIASYAAGILSEQDSAQAAAQLAVDGALRALVAADAKIPGKNLSQGYADGIRSKIDAAARAAQEVAHAAINALNRTQDSHSPSRVTMQSGLWFDAGYAEGIDKGTGKVEKAAQEMSSKILHSANEWVSEQKFYSRLALKDEVEFWTKMQGIAGLQAKELAEIDKNLYTARREAAQESAKAAADASKAAFDESKRWIDNEKYYNRLSAQEEVAAWQRVTERKNLLTAEQTEAEKQLYAAQKAVINENKKELEEYDKSVAARIQSLSSFSGLFDKIEQDSKISGRELLSNLKGQVEAFQGWQSDIQALADKGVTGALLKELQEMGPAAVDEIRALSQLTERELREYAETFAEKTALIEEQARKELPPVTIPVALDMEAVNNAAQLLTAAFENTMNEKNADVKQTGAQSVDILSLGMQAQTKAVVVAAAGLVESFRNTVNEKSAEVHQTGAQNVDTLSLGMLSNDALLRQRTSTLMQSSISTAQSFYGGFRATGNYMMQGVAQGVTEGRSGLINTIVRTLEAAVSAAKMAMDIHSPSKVWAEVGGYMAQGLGVGFTGRMHTVAKQITDSIPVPSVESPRAMAERIGEATVNGIATAMQGGAGAPMTIVVPVHLDGIEVTRVVADYAPQVARQRG